MPRDAPLFLVGNDVMRLAKNSRTSGNLVFPSKPTDLSKSNIGKASTPYHKVRDVVRLSTSSVRPSSASANSHRKSNGTRCRAKTKLERTSGDLSWRAYPNN